MTKLLYCLGDHVSAASSCILVPFERYGHPKKCSQKSSYNTFTIYISHKSLMKYNLQILKNKTLFKRHKYSSPNALNIKSFWTINCNHWGVFGITKLSNPLYTSKKRYAQKISGCGTACIQNPDHMGHKIYLKCFQLLLTTNINKREERQHSRFKI